MLVNQGGSLTTLGRAQARELGERLRGERIAHVYCSTIARAVQTAELAAGVLGVDVTVREGLGEFAVGEAYGKPAGAGIFVDEMRRWVAGDVDATYPGSESAVDDRRAGATRAGRDRRPAPRRGCPGGRAHGGAIVATLGGAGASSRVGPGTSWRTARTSCSRATRPAGES